MSHAPKGSRRVCILTLDPRTFGGVIELQRVTCAALERFGLEPELVFLSAVRRERVRLLPAEVPLAGGRRGVQLGYLPSIDFLNYAVPAVALRQRLSGYAAWQVASGSSAAALPLVLNGYPFVSWISTTVRSEFDSARVQTAALRPSLSRRLNNLLMPINELVEREVLRRTPTLFALSKATATDFERYGLRNTPVLYPPVDLDLFRPDQETPFPRPYIFAAGRVDDIRKDFDFLIQAVAEARRRVPKLSLVIAGPLQENSLVKKRARELLGDAALLVGRLDVKKLAAAHSGAAAFALSSRQEGLGIVAAEAMASGTPTVQRRCGGADELVEEGMTGFLVEPTDVSGFADRLALLALNDEQRVRMGRAARERARDLFSRELFEASLRAAYQRTFPGLLPG